jgi:hypothetical protein
MISKKNDEKMKPCPFRKMKPCDPECVFFRKGIRYNTKTNETFPFTDCVINLIGDNLEAMHQRTHMMQSEVGETKNIMTLKIMSDLGMIKRDEVERQAKKMMQLPTDDQLIIEDSPKKIEG